MLRSLLEMCEALVTFLDAISSPRDYPDLESESADGSWNWDRYTRVKAQGLKAALCSFQTVAVFTITKNILDEVRDLAAKLQTLDQDIFVAYGLVYSVTERIEATRQDIDNRFNLWYQDILQLANSIGSVESVPRKTNLQENRSNAPSQSPTEHYKRSVAIPLLDSLLLQLRKRFNGDQDNIQALLCLVPTHLVRSDVDPMEEVDGMMHWQTDLPFPKSIRSEVRRWQSVWQGKSQEMQEKRKRGQECTKVILNNLLMALGACDSQMYPNVHRLLLIACTLPMTSAEAGRSFSLLRRLKTYARSTMAEERLADLTVIAMYYKEWVPVDKVCHAFVQNHPRRMFLPSWFERDMTAP